ncbi:ATP-binding protein [Streptomyces mashuensis]|uniref:ATP-binding protein n=1 Tax=Streptomyces mashuensis TaxID=33904 RepID=A0A919EF96_9ACTN|nr:NACHT domain-containing protein [Streptomyces mashuensis]GHF63295.1 ATP-binding protein [Streptomyces mashuensis]
MASPLSVEDRVVAVLGEQQGSGVLLTPRLVLTSAHVVGGRPTAEVARPGGEGLTECEVVWRYQGHEYFLPGVDGALLRAEESLLPDESLATMRWGRAGSEPIRGCQVLGFPQVQRYAGDQLEAVQITGTLTPFSGKIRDRYVLRLDHQPPEPIGGRSPWAGLSGGPLFAGEVLLGTVVSDAAGWNHSAIEASPLSTLQQHPGFILAIGRKVPLLDTVRSVHPADRPYEAQYAKALTSHYSRMEIFGLDELGANENDWDLDTAYLSLEARSAEDDDPPHHRTQRIEDLLASRPRTLLRGEAGAGKTTLVWWLASHAARGTLPEALEPLNGLVPFVVPMRSLAAQGITAPTPAQLPTVAQLPLDAPPDGWAGRVLEDGRALLLVDGMDELPQRDRAPARKWLTGLLRMYPDTRCLVTVRPQAVEQNWLGAERFEELRLLPMSDVDIQAFVAAWHEAARLEYAGMRDRQRAKREQARLTALEMELGQEFHRNAVLRDLARTPLLCAVICALHRRRSGLLPRTRHQLYEAALSMLLGDRDAHRRIQAPEGIELTVEEGQQLLQRIAVWLVRNGRAELSRQQALRQVGLAMKGLRKVREQGAPEAVLTHLLNRSGLLQERTTGSLQFIHRTFQDFLAAKEFKDSDSLGELLSHAGNEQWQDVIRLVIGHCGRREAQGVVDDLMAAADKAPGREEEWPLRVLAAECAQAAPYVDEEQHDAVWGGLRALCPPLSDEEAGYLASLGPDVLPVLPGPEDVSAPWSALLTVRVLGRLGDPAVPLLRRYGQHPEPGVRHEVVEQWAAMDLETYARDVLAGIRLDDIEVLVPCRAALAHLPLLGPTPDVVLRENQTSDDIRRGLRGRALVSLSLLYNADLTDLEFLRDHPELQMLRILFSSEVLDASAMTVPTLRHLHISLESFSAGALHVLPALRHLTRLSVIPRADGKLPPAHPGVEELVVENGFDPVELDGIDEWRGLRQVRLDSPLASSDDLGVLAALPALRVLRFPLMDVRDLETADGFPGVRHLAVQIAGSTGVLDERLFRAFPGLRELGLAAVGRAKIVLDLTRHPDPSARLDVTVPSLFDFTVLGADRFGDRLTIKR